jgi:hypothetical protein
VSNQSFSRIVGPNIHISPPPSSLVLDECPSNTAGPNTQELQNIKNMILSLQLDLQEERCKRECLEETVSKFEGNLTQKFHKISEHKWLLSDMRVPNEEIPKNQSFLPARGTINDFDQKIEELMTDFDLRLRSLDQSLLEIRSVLANDPDKCLKGYRKCSLGARPSEHKDYNRFLYKKLERGVFPRQMSLKNAITKTVGELLRKPWSEKTEIEAIMDQYYLDNLPPAFLQPDDIENEERTQMTKVQVHSSSDCETRRKILELSFV